jgi:hypothetical protein
MLHPMCRERGESKNAKYSVMDLAYVWLCALGPWLVISLFLSFSPFVRLCVQLIYCGPSRRREMLEIVGCA